MKIDYKLIDYKENFYNILSYENTNNSDLSYRNHWHRSIEFSYCLCGNIVFNVNGILKELKSEDFLFINSSEPHFVKYIDNSEPFKMMTMYISYDFLRKEFSDIDNYNIYILNNKSKEYKFIRKRLKAIFNVFINYEYNILYKTKIKYLAYGILYKILKKCLYKKAYNVINIKNYNNDWNYIKIILEYVRNHYDKDIGISEISKIVGLNPNYFCRYFKEKTNYTFHQFLNMVRLNSAIDNLKNSNSTVLESSCIAGFPNVKSFINVCKKVYGVTPKELINIKNKISI